MRIGSRGMAITIAALSLAGSVAGSASAAPVETVLHGFSGFSDGAFPFAGLIADEQGALYGTTAYGGDGTSNLNEGHGAVFKLTPPAKGQTAWTETVLYKFCSQPGCRDGADPIGALIADKQGALYGTTNGGGIGVGIGTCAGFLGGCGTVFKLTPPASGQTAWPETVLYRFKGGSDGAVPEAALIADEQDALYGTTFGGGNVGGLDGNAGNGTVFKLTPPAKNQTAWTETVLYRFCSQSSCSDGAVPVGALIADKRGAFYSITSNGGGGNVGNGGYGFGTVFKLTPPASGQTAWTETVLYRFKGGSDGAYPSSGLIADKQHALYATTNEGGGGGDTGNYGTVFKLTP